MQQTLNFWNSPFSEKFVFLFFSQILGFWAGKLHHKFSAQILFYIMGLNKFILVSERTSNKDFKGENSSEICWTFFWFEIIVAHSSHSETKYVLGAKFVTSFSSKILKFEKQRMAI